MRGVSLIDKQVRVVYVLALLLCSSCSAYRTTAKHPFSSLKDTTGWISEVMEEGMVLHTFAGSFPDDHAYQNVNVLEVDLARYQLAFEDFYPTDSLSSVGFSHEEYLAGINGTYYEIARNERGDSVSSSFFKRNGGITSQVNIPNDHILAWKHEGAFYYDAEKDKWGIRYGDSSSYNRLEYANVLSGSPMLIHQGNPVGASFAKERNQPLNELHYEDPDRHQGVRHPRTAIALTSEDRLLLVTVDGRRTETAGMNARELTLFLQHYFAVKDALNIDGGGSTTMWIRTAPQPNGVVNYPTDNKRYDHFGQRKIRNAIFVKKGGKHDH